MNVCPGCEEYCAYGGPFVFVNGYQPPELSSYKCKQCNQPVPLPFVWWHRPRNMFDLLEKQHLSMVYVPNVDTLFCSGDCCTKYFTEKGLL